MQQYVPIFGPPQRRLFFSVGNEHGKRRFASFTSDYMNNKEIPSDFKYLDYIVHSKLNKY